MDSEARSYSGLRTETVQNAAKACHAQLPDTHGFIIILMPFGDGNGEGKADYVSNVKREDAVAALKAILFRWGIDEQWMHQAK